jgi:hypothetical protein
MALTANQLRKQVDLPTWEWLRFSPVAPTGGLSCSCSADNALFNENSGRYIYYLLNATNFWRYDTIGDSYQQLATPPATPASIPSMRFAGAQGYYNRVISATSSTIVTGLPSGRAAIGYKIRIVSGKGAGQERLITNVSDPIVADFGGATAGSTTSLTDSAKNWYDGYTGSAGNFNKWVGYVLRTYIGTGVNQVRKILYNTNTVLTIGDPNFYQNDTYSSVTMVTPAAGTVYQIESSTITVDTVWDITPDSTSRFVIQSGAIWLIVGATAAPFYTLQYYDVLADTWYSKSALTNMMTAAPTDVSLERVTENSSIWWQGTASAGTTTSLTDDISPNWTTNEWAGYELYIYSGTGRGQIAVISSNTGSVLTFPTLATAPDATSKYVITGYDGGKATAATATTISDSSRSWTANQWTNFAVRILSGTGAGQLRTIVSNTDTMLRLNSGWNILPDTSSIYVIQGNSEAMYIAWGGSATAYVFQGGNLEMLVYGRMNDSGIACLACALLTDVDHTIYEQMPYAISGFTGTTTITATTVQPHNLKVGQYVSIRGVTSATADQYNITGAVQILSVPTVTSFTYTPSAAGSGTYALLTALSTSNLSDASKDFRDNLSSANTTSLTFTRKTPSNINGWYVSGTNIIPGTTVASGAGTTTLVLSATMSSTPSGVMIFSPWGPSTAISGSFSSGGGAGVASVTLTASTSSAITGWYVVGTGIAIGATVTSGAGSATIVLSSACTGSVSGTITFYPPHNAGKVIVMGTTAPTITTGATTGQLMQATSSGVAGGTMGFITTLGTAPTAAISRYAVTNTQQLAAAIDGQTINYLSGVATGGSTTTLVDASAFWATATGTGSAQGTTISLSAAAPGNVNGWYVTGTGINTGAKIISGAGTTTLTVDIPHSGAVSGIITCAAWNQSLVGRRIKIQSGATGLNQELIISIVSPTSGTLTFATATAPVNNVASYSIISKPVAGTGLYVSWASGNSVIASRGRYIWMVRGGASPGIDKMDLTNDKIIYNYLTPFTETFTTGSMWAYDQTDRIYFTKEITQRVYYLDLNTGFVHGAGVMPYTAGTAGLGNKMEVFVTVDGLKYMWINRHQAQEHFRQLLFW